MLVSVNVQGLVAGVSVAIVVQLGGDRPGLDCSVTRKNGAGVRTMVTELVVVLEMPVNLGAFGVGSSPASPLNVTPAVKAKALPSIALLVFITMRSEERREGKERRSRWSPYH